MADLTLLGISGSLRAGSYNRKLLAEARARFAPARYLEGDLRLPLYDGDLEEREGVPESVTRLTDQIAEADAIVIAAPEYNKGVTGVMKNALDWISRVPGFPLADKPTALISANAGRTGGGSSCCAPASCRCGPPCSNTRRSWSPARASISTPRTASSPRATPRRSTR
jgi:chromate reductase